jgi:hypothetical protein
MGYLIGLQQDFELIDLECVFDFDDKAGDFKIEQQSSYLWTLFQV